jgi:hypothetical protein
MLDHSGAGSEHTGAEHDGATLQQETEQAG